ncbi:MFS general substrate transporter [Saitoella complicata NRRL Y-17804]|uniref:MFS general substrate transporter n=1 Tax=Saitoella complicata (strain BCRC 22490 / CBS 7301 / JCM 7358 / NBRC 10748 / NRRL Y-17804) TaxID=698492 RepID=UPI0008679A9A|nr:MFS general substrate transporter [Saitoella complicata NRRL Y-17804]ODQ51201.1 MFS general substrate transporter [Saitoella complicata NRRL Y-17804]
MDEALDELAYRLPKDVGKTGPIEASVLEVTESTDGLNDTDREARPPVLRSLAHEVLFLITCATATALSSLSVGSANTALISIGNDLNMHDASSLSWIISAFSLTSGCVMLSSGRAADLYGRQRVFLIGGVIFTIACIICGFAVNKEMMYMLRAVQGLGTGICTPAGAGMIGAMYLPDTRRKEKAFGLLGGASALAFLTGTVLGGICSELLNWRWIYWIMAVISALMTLGGVFVVPKGCNERNPGQLDWMGLILSVVGMSLLTYSVTGSTGAPFGWRTWYIPILFVVSIFVIALFIWSQHRQSDPMMPLSIWSFPNFALIMVIVFLAWGVFEVITVYLALYFQNIKKTTPLLTSASFVPDMLFGLISIPLPAFMLKWFPKRWVLCISLILLFIPTILYAFVDEDTTYWAIPFPGISISAIGAFLLYNLANLFCSSSAPPEKQ